MMIEETTGDGADGPGRDGRRGSGAAIPARADVDLSFIRTVATDATLSQTEQQSRSVNPSGTRSRARAVLKAKPPQPKMCSGASFPGNTVLLDQVKQNATRVRVGFADTVGRRPSMEDQIVICGDDLFDLVGVFDGHNGPHVSKFLADNLVEVSRGLWDCFWELTTLSVYISHQHLYVELFRKLNGLIKASNVPGGSTGLLITLTNEEVFVANAGDCRCVMGKGSYFKRVTVDHKPDEPTERARIEACGGEVIVRVTEGHSIARVNGILGVARSFGDFELEGYISCDPDVYRLTREEFDENYVIAACDGLWDVVEDSVHLSILPYKVTSLAIKAVTEYLAENAGDVEGAAKKLRDLAYSTGSTDNISVVVMSKWEG